MKHLLLSLCLLLPTLACANSVQQIKVKDPYVRAMPAEQTNSAAYMELINEGDKAIELVNVSSSVAAKVEMHEVIMNEGVAKMQAVEQITLAPKSTTSMAPGGLHIMLLGLKETLKPGQTIPLTLTFKDGSNKTIGASVRDIRTTHEHHH